MSNEFSILPAKPGQLEITVDEKPGNHFPEFHHHEQRIAALEAKSADFDPVKDVPLWAAVALGAQRDVNEALLLWLNAPSDRRHAAYEPLVATLRAALNPTRPYLRGSGEPGNHP